MSIEARRQSALKSSLSIKTIQSSVTSFGEGLKKSQNSATKIAQQTSESNKFKSTLIRKDNDFFARRRENVKRRQREDELEAASSGGVLKRTGSLVARSTKGFLGRILDFFAISLLGFFVLQLPRILSRFQLLFKLIGGLLRVLKFFTDGVADFLVSLQEGVFGLIDRIRGVNLEDDEPKIKDSLNKTVEGLTLLNNELEQGGLGFIKDTNRVIQKVAKEDGIDAPPAQSDTNNTPPSTNENTTDNNEIKSNEDVEKEIGTLKSQDLSINLSDGDEEKESSKLISSLNNSLDSNNTIIPPAGMTGANETEDEKESKGFFDRLSKFTSKFFKKDSAGDNGDAKQELKVAIDKEKSLLTEKSITDQNNLIELLKGSVNGSEKSSVENMFDGFGSSNLDLIDVDGLKRFSDVNVSTERKATTILVNQTVTGSGNSKSVSSGGVNSSNLSSMFMMNKDDKTMDQIQSIILNL